MIGSLIGVEHVQHVLNRPNLVCHASGYGWRGLDREMLTAEVVNEEMQPECQRVIRQVLAVAVCEPRESAAGHAERQIRAFNQRCADSAHIGIAEYRHLLGADAYLLPFLVLPVDLDQLSKISVREIGTYGPAIRAKSVRCDLQMAREAVSKIGAELKSRVCAAITDEPASNQLCVGAKGFPCPHVAGMLIDRLLLRPFLAADERPHFIHLQFLASQVPQMLVLIPVAGFPEIANQLGYSVEADPSHARGGAHTVPLRDHFHDQGSFGAVESVHAFKLTYYASLVKHEIAI